VAGSQVMLLMRLALADCWLLSDSSTRACSLHTLCAGVPEHAVLVAAAAAAALVAVAVAVGHWQCRLSPHLVILSAACSHLVLSTASVCCDPGERLLVVPARDASVSRAGVSRPAIVSDGGGTCSAACLCWLAADGWSARLRVMPARLQASWAAHPQTPVVRRSSVPAGCCCCCSVCVQVFPISGISSGSGVCCLLRRSPLPNWLRGYWWGWPNVERRSRNCPHYAAAIHQFPAPQMYHLCALHLNAG